jgi:hypothetical protein
MRRGDVADIEALLAQAKSSVLRGAQHQA